MAAARGGFTVHVEGYREAARAMARVNRGASRAILSGIAEAARPIADDANQVLSRYVGVGQMVTRATVSGVFIRQSKRKVTGARGDFGALQMQKGLIPAAEKGEPEIVLHVEHALDSLIAREGLS